MMRCGQARGEIHRYIDGRLPATRLGALEAHLAECAACRNDLRVLEAIREVVAEDAWQAEPPNLTALILARVAAYEAERRARYLPVGVEVEAAGVGVRAGFALHWGDAVLAGMLATLSTLFFVLLDPSLRSVVPLALARSFPGVVAILSAPGPGAIAWAAWLVWIVVGVGLTLWLAGAEVRLLWRRSLAARLAHVPQLPQLW